MPGIPGTTKPGPLRPSWNCLLLGEGGDENVAHLAQPRCGPGRGPAEGCEAVPWRRQQHYAGLCVVMGESSKVGGCRHWRAEIRSA